MEETMRDVDGLNSGYAALLLEQFLNDPASVPAEWRSLFESGQSSAVAAHPVLRRLRGTGAAAGSGNGHAGSAEGTAPGGRGAAVTEPSAPPVAHDTGAEAAASGAPSSGVDELLLGGVAAAMALVKAHRTHGHLAAQLDPLGSPPPGDPALEPLRLEPPLTPELQARIPARLLRLYVPAETLLDALPLLHATYCGTIAFEIEHISSHEQRLWLRQAIESGRYRQPLSAEEQRTLLARLSEVEGFERYLRRAFLGQKQFSIEGLDVMVPMLDEAIALAAEDGAQEVVIGMAHRGRLNVLAHTVGQPYEAILREFEGERALEAVVGDPEGGTGDVKYHLGAEGHRNTPAGRVTVTLAANPSHLEAVDPVVEGRTRAEQTDRSTPLARHDPSIACAILIHGDASFAGQGVVAETLNLEGLPGYRTGGTLHVVANNQIGFTTDPGEARSTRYSSDLAKGFDTPIIHVNADDPEAAIAAIRLAEAYRRTYANDVVVDLVGYRRFGHNEQDEPAYTQPLQAALIEAHPTVREQYAAKLVAEGVVTEAEAAELATRVEGMLREAHDHLRANIAAREHSPLRPPRAARAPVVATAVEPETLRQLNEELLRVPEGFMVNPKLLRQLERRRATLDEGTIDWGQAEALAYATLVTEGIPVRLTGQDTERGTFSHRHLVLHDAQTGERYAPIQHLEEAVASFEVHNSPLSEFAALGFEYGYSVAAPEALVLWEAQFGDFVNGAQVIVDQFLVAGLSKWGQTSRLTLLLPHGYEGNGPEHSSARLERFLQSTAQDNLRVVNCSTAAQYFHLLRRQALDPTARPLVVMTPKGLLRLREAASPLEKLTGGTFEPVLDDETAERDRVRRLVLCSGKLYYDLVGHEARAAASDVAVARVEQLYPFPAKAVRDVVRGYRNISEVIWAQEEPQNMGAWRSIRHRLEEALEGTRLRYAGRPWRASPSEGYPTAHLREQDRIVRAAIGEPAHRQSGAAAA
jgi:2-oxoglutarate dehydrogenase E1 component